MCVFLFLSGFVLLDPPTVPSIIPPGNFICPFRSLLSDECRARAFWPPNPGSNRTYFVLRLRRARIRTKMVVAEAERI